MFVLVLRQENSIEEVKLKQYTVLPCGGQLSKDM